MSDIRIINQDCMDAMKEMPDKAFDLAICDIPYGIGAGEYKRGGTRYGKSCAPCKVYDLKIWDKEPPPFEYFSELRRISINQILWGANHFIDKIPVPSSCWIVWDKLTGNNGYADCELAWTSLSSTVRKFTYKWQGMLQGDMKNKEKRIHPTQKPVRLYEWLLKNYAKPGDKILDTHGGSCSLAIACDIMGYDCTIYEIDEDYYKAAVDRFERHKMQGVLPL